MGEVLKNSLQSDIFDGAWNIYLWPTFDIWLAMTEIISLSEKTIGALIAETVPFLGSGLRPHPAM